MLNTDDTVMMRGVRGPRAPTSSTYVLIIVHGVHGGYYAAAVHYRIKLASYITASATPSRGAVRVRAFLGRGKHGERGTG